MHFEAQRVLRRAWGAVLGSSVGFALSCTGDIAGNAGEGIENAAAAHEQVATVSALSLGATGPEVLEVQDYLMQYGYFPSDELVERFPDWVSVTAVAPEMGVFDEATEDAVRAFQARNGLEATGIVGPDMRDMMSQARCGNPDSFEHDDDSKFSIKEKIWSASKRTFTWKVIDPSQCQKWGVVDPAKGTMGWIPCFSASNPAPATREQMRQLAIAAFTIWGAETDISFIEQSGGTTDISFAWAEFHGDCTEEEKRRSVHRCQKGVVAKPGTVALAVSSYPTGTNTVFRSDIVFNQALPMSPTAPVPTDRYDMLAVTLHEVGHALGLDHSSADIAYGVTPVMQPAFAKGPGQPRSLSFDDTIGISARYDKWNLRPGIANHIAAGADGSFWHIGTAPTGDGYRIYKWNSISRDWEEASGNGGAVRIAIAPSGVAWVVTSMGAVFNHSANHREGIWHHIPNLCATDVATGGDGSVWFVTCNVDYEGGYNGYKVGKLVIVPLTPDSIAFGIAEVQAPTHALRLAVGKHGHPWIVNVLGDVYWGSPNPATPGWNHVAGVKAAAISLSPNDYAFVTGSGPNLGRLYILNYQPEVKNDGGEVRVPGRDTWYELARLPSGTPAFIAAGRRTVWATNTSKAMYEQTAKGGL